MDNKDSKKSSSSSEKDAPPVLSKEARERIDENSNGIFDFREANKIGFFDDIRANIRALPDYEKKFINDLSDDALKYQWEKRIIKQINLKLPDGFMDNVLKAVRDTLKPNDEIIKPMMTPTLFASTVNKTVRG